jgi:hypothetical protein
MIPGVKRLLVLLIFATCATDSRGGARSSVDGSPRVLSYFRREGMTLDQTRIH